MNVADTRLEELYGQYAHVVYKRAWYILGNEEDAHDAVQETFARVIVHWDQFRQEASPLTWMYRISTNYCLNLIRDRSGRAGKRERHRDAIVGEGFDRGNSEAWETDETIRRLLEKADDETRTLIIHLYFDDLTREEAAVAVGISQPTLRKRLNRFMEQARAALEPPGRKVGVAGLMLIAAFLLLRGLP